MNVSGTAAAVAASAISGRTALTNSSSAREDEFPRPPSLEEITICGVLISIVALFGVMANMVSLAIFSRPEMRSSVNCCLQGLAVFDIGVLLGAFLMIGLTTLGKSFACFRFYTWTVFPFVVPVVYPLALVSQTGSIWSTVAVTVERYVAVCHPLKARSLCTFRRARLYNLAIFTFALTYNLPRFFEVQRLTVLNEATNDTIYAVGPSEFRKNQIYFQVYYIGLYLLVMYAVPFCVLAVLNTFIWRTVQQANVERRMLSRKFRKEVSLAIMLLGVVAIFFVCNILAPVINILEYFRWDVPVLNHLSNLMVTINSAANLVVYCLFGHRFKKFFLFVFCRSEIRETYSFRESLRWTSIRATKNSSVVDNSHLTVNLHL